MTEKRQIQVEHAADNDRLFSTIPKTIAYLQEMQRTLPADAHFCEIREGYEDWHFAFVYDRPETDKEYEDRLHHETLVAEMEKRKSDQEAERKKDENEARRLAAKLGWRLS